MRHIFEMKHGKRLVCILMAALMGASVLACSQREEDDPEDLAPLSSAVSEKPLPPYLSDQELFYNTFGFSFMPPERMRNGRCYSKSYTNVVMEGQDMEYNRVDYIFDDDTEHPILSIYIVPMAWWSEKSAVGDTQYTFLGEQDGLAYVYTVATEVPNDGDGVGDLYRSMIPTADEISYAFTLQEIATSTLTAMLIDGAMQTLVVKTDDGRELTFEKGNAEIIAGDEGLLIGQRVSLTYTGVINGADASGAHLTQIEVVEPEAGAPEE